MLGNIKPAVESIEYTGERTSKNNEFINIICESNVRNTTDQIRIKSPILKEMEANGETKIVDSVYDMDNGKVVWLE
jgi:carbonic anhydrase